MVLFFLEGEERKGYGHLVRGLALGRACRDKGMDVAFLCTNKDAYSYLSGAGGRTEPFQVHMAGPDEAANAVLSIAPGVLVYDGTGPLSFEDISAFHRRGVFVIECDRGNGESWADEVINGFEQTLCGAHGRPFTLVGNKFFILRPEFAARAAGRRAPRTEDPALFLCFGGSDPSGLTEPVLKAVLKTPGYGMARIDVVAGFNTGRDARLRSRYGDFENVRIHSKMDSKDIAGLMQESHLAIVSFGTILLEALSMELPVFMVNPTRAHEEYAGRVLKTSFCGTGKAFGYPPHIDWGSFSYELSMLRRDPERLEAMGRQAKGLIDGMGLYRVAEYIGKAEKAGASAGR